MQRFYCFVFALFSVSGAFASADTKENASAPEKSYLQPSHAITQPQEYNFKVYLDDRLIGRHQVSLHPQEDSLEVAIKADFEVKFLFLTAFEYIHRVQEKWKDGCLLNIDATTDNNGEDLFLKGELQGNSFELQSHQGDQQLEECVRSFAYWNPAYLNADHLLNMQTADYEKAKFEYLGEEQLIINEKPFTSDQYLLTAGENEVYLWYSPEGKWLALESETGDGYQIRYLTEDAF